MLPVFRKLRRNENRFTRYLLYAVGEIILIIVGIYCAIQLNNWNERSKENEQIEALIDKYEAELILTIKHADWDLENGQRYDSLTNAILDGKVTMEDYWNNPTLGKMIDLTFTLDPTYDNLHKILEREESLPDKYVPVIQGIKTAGFWREREVLFRERMWESAERNTNFINLNYDWARQSDTLQRTAAITYFLQSPEHKKRLWAHWYHVETYLTAIYNSRKSAYRLLADLKVHRENLSADDMRKYYDSLGLNGLVAFDCNAAPTKVYLHGGEATLITNLSSDTIALKTFDFYDNIPRTYRLGPKQTRFTHTQWIKGDGLSPHYMDLLDGENCQMRYIQKQNGYLVVE